MVVFIEFLKNTEELVPCILTWSQCMQRSTRASARQAVQPKADLAAVPSPRPPSVRPGPRCAHDSSSGERVRAWNQSRFGIKLSIFARASHWNTKHGNGKSLCHSNLLNCRVCIFMQLQYLISDLQLLSYENINRLWLSAPVLTALIFHNSINFCPPPFPARQAPWCAHDSPSREHVQIWNQRHIYMKKKFA